MRNIFIFTAALPAAQAHLHDSIIQAVPYAKMQDALGEDRADYHRSLTPGQEGFYAWGAVPGPGNKRTWNAMQAGDLLLTVYGNRYRFFSSVIGKIHSESLASKIWGRDTDGNTWEYMYQLSEPKAIDVDVMSQPVVDYLNRGYRGFTRISDEKVHSILRHFGRLEQFFGTVFHHEIPETPINRELRQAELESDATTGFDPLSLADGRRKVIQEIVRRQGQPKFRKLIFAAYQGKCAVTGCSVESVLEAAHIVPYLGAESNAVQNGLLLRADIHTLFDLGELKISPTGKIQLHEKLLGTEYTHYEGKRISFPIAIVDAPSSEALALKFNQVL